MGRESAIKQLQHGICIVIIPMVLLFFLQWPIALFWKANVSIFIIIINKFGFNGQESLKKRGEQNLWQGLLYI